MRKHKDYSNTKIGKITLLKYVDINKHGSTRWEYLCDCGNTGMIDIQTLKIIKHKSCGCNKMNDNNLVGLIGKRFGRLLILEDLGTELKWGLYRRKVKTLCNCGKICYQFLAALKSGQIKSCGCLLKEEVGKRSKIRETTHGLSKHPLYRIWMSMKERCYNSKNKSFKNYGGRGILVSSEWVDDFYNFYKWAMDNNWQKGLQIDRIENDGNYSEYNCRIVTAKLNNRNKRTNINIKYNGETKCITDWATTLGITASSLTHRIYNNNWPIDKALTTKKVISYAERYNKTH